MPKQSEAQILGDAGELWFQTQLPPGWMFQRPTRDVGVDGVVVICEAGPLNGREFRVQIKTSKHFRVRGDAVVIRGVKRSTIDYWFVSPLPTMIVAYDVRLQRGYYRWHSDLFGELARLQSDTARRSVSFTIPIQNVLVLEAWNDIRESLLWHDRNLRMALHDARDSRLVSPTLHSLAAAARQLTSIDHQPIPEAERTSQQEGLLALLEMMHHRDVLTVVARLLGELLPGSEGSMRLSHWMDEYRSGVMSVFPRFDTLPEGDEVGPDFEIAYDRSLLHVVRPRLIEAALELIMLLTLASGADENEGVQGEA